MTRKRIDEALYLYWPSWIIATLLGFALDELDQFRRRHGAT